MPAHKGNEYAREHWYQPLADEPTKNAQTRLPQSQVEKIKELLLPGETQSEFLRTAITKYMKERAAELNN